MEKVKEIAKKWVNILSGVYIFYSIWKAFHAYMNGVNMEYLMQHLAFIVIGLIFIGSSIILTIGHYERDRELRREMVELFSKAKIFWDYFYQSRAGRFSHFVDGGKDANRVISDFREDLYRFERRLRNK